MYGQKVGLAIAISHGVQTTQNKKYEENENVFYP